MIPQHWCKLTLVMPIWQFSSFKPIEVRKFFISSFVCCCFLGSKILYSLVNSQNNIYYIYYCHNRHINSLVTQRGKKKALRKREQTYYSFFQLPESFPNVYLHTSSSWQNVAKWHRCPWLSTDLISWCSGSIQSMVFLHATILCHLTTPLLVHFVPFHH